MKSMLKSLLPVAAAALALTSCSNDAAEEVTPKGKPKTLEVNAVIDQTRTTMAGDHVRLEWSDGDMIHLYVGENASQGEVIDHTIGEKITAEYENGNNVYAYYSTKVSNKPSEGVKRVVLNIPSRQTQTAADAFAGEYLPMAAAGTIQDGKVSLKFKPLGCVLVFNVYGPDTSEKIESIRFETSVGCCGYDSNMCDLTAEPVQYIAYENGKSATVTLTNAAAVGASKPDNSQTGSGNQVYLVVAPVAYPAGSKFIITTESKKTYTFTTANGINCSGMSARAVNINLANASEMQPKIEVPDVPQQSSDGGKLVINNIVFENIAAGEAANAEVGVYSDVELTRPLGNPWLTFDDTSTLASGQLTCRVAANTTAANRTAYIGIKCADVQAAIAVTQVAAGATTDKYFVKVTSNLNDWKGKYLIVYEGENKAFNGALTGDALKNAQNYISVEITGQGILSNDTTNAAVVNISKKEGSTDEYMLQTASEYYLYASSDSNMLSATKSYNTAAKYKQYISIESDYAKIACSGAVLRFNTASNADYFRYYSSTTYDRQQPVQLYKLQE